MSDVRIGGTDKPIAQVIGASALGFGVLAAAAPRVMANVFGVAPNSETKFLLRVWGLGSAQAGLELVLADDQRVRTRLLAVAAVVDGVACAFALRAGLPMRTTALVALTFGTVSAAAAAGLATGSGADPLDRAAA
jgi:hypothetical protein